MSKPRNISVTLMGGPLDGEHAVLSRDIKRWLFHLYSNQNWTAQPYDAHFVKSYRIPPDERLLLYVYDAQKRLAFSNYIFPDKA